MNQILPWLGVFVAALIGGLLGAGPTMALALSFSLLIILPMIFGVAAMFAALAAAWFGNILAPKRDQSRLLRVVAVSEVAALVVSVLFFLVILWLQTLPTGAPPIFLPLVLIGSVVVAIVATFAAWRYRKPRVAYREDGLVTLGLLGVTAMAVIWAQGFAFLLGQFGL